MKWITPALHYAAKANTNNNTSTMATTAVQHKYVFDKCGIKNRVNPEDETTTIPCEPWCTSCGYPPHICDPYWTKCARTKIGRWFDEAQDRWIEAEPIMTQEQKEALDRWIEAEPNKTPEQEEKEEEKDRWSQHKYGLCPGCKVGLDDRADFRCSYVNGTDNGIIMCWDCYEKERSSQQVCTNCFHPVNDGDVVIGSLHPISKQRVVTFCRRC